MSTLRVNALENVSGLGSPTQNKSPALSAVRITASQGVSSGVWTKVQYNSVTFDPTTDWDAVNYRFIPQVEGMYSVMAVVDPSGSVSTSEVNISIYKNGVAVRQGMSTTNDRRRANVAGAIQMNGTTDYLEIWVNITGSSPAVAGNVDMFLARAGA